MKRWLPLLDILTCVALMAYVLLGVPTVPFHGDEPMQIYMSRDYEIAFVDRNADVLTQGPPYFIDDDNQLRILNGSVQRYTVGLLRQVAGIPREALPPRPGWDWGLDYARNVETNHRPDNALLLLGRYTSAVMLAASIPMMFAIGRLLGGRPAAYGAVLVYALHPVVLLNGRRAVQEGAMLCFGLLTILTAVVINTRAGRGQRTWFLFPALAAAGVMALASKHAAAPFVAGAFAWIGLAALLRKNLRGILATTGLLAIGTAATVAGFIALSPALWRDPPARLSDLFTVRAELLGLQVAAHSDGETALSQRVAGLLREPFLRPTQYFESPAWADFAPISAEIAAYEAGPWRGYATGVTVPGIALTVLMLGGLVVLVVPRRRPLGAWWPTAGLCAWLLVTAGTLLVNPLDWQRYALPLLPIAALLAGLAPAALIKRYSLRAQKSTTMNTASA